MEEHMIDTIQLDNANPTTWMGYTHKGITITPEPVRVGRPSTITLYLQNTGISPVIIRRVESKIAEFGIGTKWTELPQIDGPLVLPADPTAVKEISLEWTPAKGGHRCVRAFVHTSRSLQPLCAGRNLQIINAERTQSSWQTPFHLGNPHNLRMPVYLTLQAAAPIQAQILVQEVAVQPGEPVWLDPGEEVSGVVLLHAQTSEAIARSIRVEATIGQQFIDGFQVEVYRPAYSFPLGYARQNERAAPHLESMALVA
jgi:hypothetical protein